MITYDIAGKVVNVHVTRHLINVLQHRHLNIKLATTGHRALTKLWTHPLTLRPAKLPSNAAHKFIVA